MEAIRRIHASWLIDQDDRVRLLDSAPIPVCTYTRSRTCQMVTGADYVGYAASDKANFFGFRLHLTTTVNQVVGQWLLAPASPHDSQVTPAFFDQCYRLWVLADNAYHSPEHEYWLAKQRAITHHEATFGCPRNHAPRITHHASRYSYRSAAIGSRRIARSAG